jgi:hypothetical protein
VAYNVEIGSNKIKMLKEYENIAQTLLLLLEQMLQNAKQLQHSRFTWHVKYPSFLDSISITWEVFGFPLLFSAEHHQFLEIALINFGYHYLKVGLFRIEFSNDFAFE